MDFGFRIAVVSASLALALAPPARAEQAVPAAAPSNGPASSSEDRAWMLSVGTGAAGIVDLTDRFVGNVSEGLAGYDTVRSGRFQAIARVDREHGRWVRIGVAYTYQRWTDEYFSTARVSHGTLRDSLNVLVADVTLRWVRGHDVELYSGVAAGAALWRERGTVGGTRYGRDEVGFAFQLRALGLSLGGERLRAFAEVGVGFEGLLVGGVALRL